MVYIVKYLIFDVISARINQYILPPEYHKSLFGIICLMEDEEKLWVKYSKS